MGIFARGLGIRKQVSKGRVEDGAGPQSLL